MNQSILPESTALETDLATYRGIVNRSGTHANMLAASLFEGHRWLWNLPTERLLAVFNHLGEERVNKLFEANTALGIAVNAALDLVDPARTTGDPAAQKRFPAVAPTVAGRTDIGFDADAGEFIEVPPTD
jgi:hypothetical protein